LIGFDCGTYNLISCKRNDEKDLVFKKEVNAFLKFSLDNPFVFNMMKKAGVPLIQREDANTAYALGEAAINMAYTMTQLELSRPMKDGCVNPAESDAFQIMSIMMHSLLDNVTNDKELVYYSVPANAINAETDADYHSKVLEAVFKAYKSPEGLTLDARPLNEGMALVYSELSEKMFTGIGISCLCPGTKIYTDKGIVEIEKVKEGDKVITHKGRWSEINKVIVKPFDGIMTKIQIAGYSNNTEEYKFVDNHELYVKRNGKWNWVGCEEIEIGDIVGEPIIGQNRNATRPSINLCERTTCSKKWNKKRIESTPNLQRFMGYFMGDGSISEKEGCIQIDFGAHETDYVQDAKEILSKRFGKNSTETSKGESVTRLKCYSQGLVNWMKNHCYDDSGEKHYPWTIDRLTNSECFNLLCGMVRADGTISEDQIVFGNTNTKLILLAKQLFSRIGFASSVGWREPREHILKQENRIIFGKKMEWTVSVAGKKICSSLVQNMNETNCDNGCFKESIFLEDGFCCGRVQAIEHEEYEGKVYDLQVPGDHSFSGPQLTIHNCGAGMVNVAFGLYGAEVFTFAIVNSGDWIDKQSAKATGETIAFINKEKTKIDLSKEPVSLVERAIKTQYELMIQKTVAGIKQGLIEHEKKARLDHPVDIVVAGGTSSPPGFDDMFRDVLKNADLPIEIGSVIRPKDPVYSVAKGCLIAAENCQPIE